MRGNRRTDTSPELRLRSLLHRLGYRFRKDHPVDVGEQRKPRPDIAFPRQRLAVFVDGCFWHLCPDHGRIPGGSNRDYWTSKLTKNRDRDQADSSALTASGWTVLRFWEHTPPEEAAEEIARQLSLTGVEVSLDD